MISDRTSTPWAVVVQGAAALAAAMGVGRFAFTPILPMMTEQAGLSASGGADLATANYLGYLIGAVAGIAVPRLVRSALVLRGSLVAVVVTLALMPISHSMALWLVLRLATGVASALTFVVSTAALLDHLGRHSAHLAGWGFGGVGAGIALSGVLVLVVRATSGWAEAWFTTAALAALLTVVSWRLPTERDSRPRSRTDPTRPRTGRWFSALFVSYSLEGVGYIIAGTFLVAAIDQNAPNWVGSGAWVIAGAAAFVAPALWARLSTRTSRPALLVLALLVQAVGIALPAVIAGLAPALVAAALFGGTFIGVTSLSLAVGAHLRFPRAVAILTSGYSVGQILGPLAVKPLLGEGYQAALLVGAAVVVASAVAAAVLRVRYPLQPPAPELAEQPTTAWAQRDSNPRRHR